MEATSVAFFISQAQSQNINIEGLELSTGQFYPVIPNKGHKSRKSWSKRFEFSTLGATN
jgi:hypothetical protein